MLLGVLLIHIKCILAMPLLIHTHTTVTTHAHSTILRIQALMVTPHTHTHTHTHTLLVVTLHYTTQALLVTLHKPATDKAVHWDEGVIDNEHMGKKTSKCKTYST